MKWAERVAVIREKKNTHEVLLEIAEGENQWEDLSIDRTIILKFFFFKK
jgi:hypothetical protein